MYYVIPLIFEGIRIKFYLLRIDLFISEQLVTFQDVQNIFYFTNPQGTIDLFMSSNMKELSYVDEYKRDHRVCIRNM